LSWNRRYSKGLLYGVSYTLSKSRDDGSNQRDVIPDTYNAHNLWGPSEFDARHIVAINGLYDLPFFRNQSNVLGKWLADGRSARSLSSKPDSLAASLAAAITPRSGSTRTSDAASRSYWVVNGDPKITGQFAANGTADPNQWFATKNPDGSSISRNRQRHVQLANGVSQSHLPAWVQNWNMGLFKKFAFNERTGMQFVPKRSTLQSPEPWRSERGGVQFNRPMRTSVRLRPRGASATCSFRCDCTSSAVQFVEEGASTFWWARLHFLLEGEKSGRQDRLLHPVIESEHETILDSAYIQLHCIRGAGAAGGLQGRASASGRASNPRARFASDAG